MQLVDGFVPQGGNQNCPFAVLGAGPPLPAINTCAGPSHDTDVTTGSLGLLLTE